MPRKILGHAIQLNAAPYRRLISENRKSLVDRTKKRKTIILLKLESCAASCCLIERIDRVVQASRGPNHGHRTVLQTVDLIQAARLVPRRHEENIRACFDLMRKDVVIRHSHT